MSETVKVEVPLAVKPGEVNKNGWYIPEDVFNKAFDEAINRPGGLPITVGAGKNPLDAYDTARTTVGKVNSRTTDVLECEIDGSKVPELKELMKAGFSAGVRAVGTFDEDEDGRYYVPEEGFHIISYGMIPYYRKEGDECTK